MEKSNALSNWRSVVLSGVDASSGISESALMLEMLLPDADLMARVRNDSVASAYVTQGLEIDAGDLYGRLLLQMAERIAEFPLSTAAKELSRTLKADELAQARATYLDRFRARAYAADEVRFGAVNDLSKPLE